MSELIASYGSGLALGLTLLKTLALLVALLVFVAFILLADRKIWAAVQLRRGPNVVGPFGLLQSFADLLKFILKEPTIPAGANKGVFLLAPLVTDSPCSLRMGRSAGDGRMGDRRYQCRHSLYFCDLVV